MCFVWISEQTAIISLYNINRLVFITETECVYCAVRPGYINTRQVKWSLQRITQNPPRTPQPVYKLLTLTSLSGFVLCKPTKLLYSLRQKSHRPDLKQRPYWRRTHSSPLTVNSEGKLLRHMHTPLFITWDIRLIYCEWQTDLLPCVYIMIASEFMATHLVWWKIHKPLSFINTNINVSLSLRKLRVILRLY